MEMDEFQVIEFKAILADIEQLCSAIYLDEPTPRYVTQAGIDATHAILADNPRRALELMRIHRTLIRFGHPAQIERSLN